MSISLILLILSALGVFSLSAGFSLSASIIALPSRFFRKRQIASKPCGHSRELSIAVIIPAHNEASTIRATLSSIKAALGAVSSKNLRVSIFVAADGCTDDTANLAKSTGASVIQQQTSLGKWRTLENLFNYADSQDKFDWIACVDSGSVWPANLLSDLFCDLLNESNCGVAPGYLRINANLIERISWKIESFLKLIENYCGGPISVHGATVFYRSGSLRKAFAFLKGKNWTNDDVVIPLVIRSLEKNNCIKYRSATKVYDQDATNSIQENTRRKRLVNGNLQWIGALGLKVLKLNPLVAIIALRRISRVFWAYWAAIISLAILTGAISFYPEKTGNILIVSSGLILFLIVKLIKSPNLQAIISASFMVPIEFLLFSRKESSWK